MTATRRKEGVGTGGESAGCAARGARDSASLPAHPGSGLVMRAEPLPAAWRPGDSVASGLLFQVGHGLVRRRRSRARSLQVCSRACQKPGPLSRASSQIWEPVLGSVRQRRLGFSVQLSCMRKARCRKAYMRSQFCKTSLDQPPKFCVYLFRELYWIA